MTGKADTTAMVVTAQDRSSRLETICRIGAITLGTLMVGLPVYNWLSERDNPFDYKTPSIAPVASYIGGTLILTPFLQIALENRSRRKSYNNI